MKNYKRKLFNWKNFLIEIIPLIYTGITLIILGIILKQKFIKLLPTLISLIVYILSARVNRFAFLIGGFNSVIYAIGFYTEGLYASTILSLTFSFPFQIASFILWSKNKSEENDVKVRKLDAKRIIILAFYSLFIWILGYFIYKTINTTYVSLDNTLFVLGIIITILQMFRFVESSYISIISTLLNIIMWTIISLNNISNITYVIYMLFALYSQIRGLFKWLYLYKKQKNNKKEEKC